MVTVVEAVPDASVVAELGDTVADPLTVKVTVAPGTAVPAASATTTVIVPPDVPTTADVNGAIVIVMLAAGPTLGPEASEPPHAAATERTTMKNERRGKLTGRER
jgi:hypothetical protein